MCIDAKATSINDIDYKIDDLHTRMTKNNQSAGGQSLTRPLVLPENFMEMEVLSIGFATLRVYLLLMDGVTTIRPSG